MLKCMMQKKISFLILYPGVKSFCALVTFVPSSLGHGGGGKKGKEGEQGGCKLFRKRFLDSSKTASKLFPTGEREVILSLFFRSTSRLGQGTRWTERRGR